MSAAVNLWPSWVQYITVVRSWSSELSEGIHAPAFEYSIAPPSNIYVTDIFLGYTGYSCWLTTPLLMWPRNGPGRSWGLACVTEAGQYDIKYKLFMFCVWVHNKGVLPVSGYCVMLVGRPMVAVMFATSIFSGHPAGLICILNTTYL